MLESEIQFFDRNIDSWANRYIGSYALVKGSELIGMFDTQLDAMEVAAEKFGLSAALIRRVSRDQHEISAPALMLGILGVVERAEEIADSSH